MSKTANSICVFLRMKNGSREGEYTIFTPEKANIFIVEYNDPNLYLDFLLQGQAQCFFRARTLKIVKDPIAPGEWEKIGEFREYGCRYIAYIKQE